tara:strand:+ start:496 stop:651 length:156 start_codon:yes stop_codon:yes gene_type:complete
MPFGAKLYKMKKKLIELPKELFDKIKGSAKKNVRSVNKEIIFLLQSATDNT